MELELRRKLKLKKYKIIAEIAKFKKREELVAVLKLAKNNGGKISPDLICNKLLANKPVRVGERIIQRCQNLDLFDKNNSLTEVGFTAAEEELIPDLERSVFSIWVSEDSILSDREKIVKIDYSSESTTDIIRKEKAIKTINIEDWITETCKEMEGLVIDGEKVRIDNIEKKGQLEKISGEEEIWIKWKISDKTLYSMKTTGFINRNLEPPKITFEMLWLNLLQENAIFWDNNDLSLTVKFDSLKDYEKRNFERDDKILQPKIDSLGIFEAVTIKYRIKPRTENDASRWAKWILINTVKNYLNEKEYDKFRIGILVQFSEYSLKLPTLKQLIDELKILKSRDEKFSRVYWYLQSPIDLKLGD